MSLSAKVALNTRRKPKRFFRASVSIATRGRWKPRNFQAASRIVSAWRACCLSEPDVLLLDEPTNHLDVDAVEWLEEFLQSYASGFVIISHDRYFLDRACQRIIEVENGQATSYTGNYSHYLVEREERREIQQRAYENQQRLIAKTEEFIRKNLAGQKTKQAKSRRTMLAKARAS